MLDRMADAGVDSGPTPEEFRIAPQPLNVIEQLVG